MGAAMIDALNIATMPIADKVHRHMLASYYALQLDALQAEAKRLGYFFAQADTAATMPPVLADCLARAVMYRRECYLNPDAPDIWGRSSSRVTSRHFDHGNGSQAFTSKLFRFG